MSAFSWFLLVLGVVSWIYAVLTTLYTSSVLLEISARARDIHARRYLYALVLTGAFLWSIQ